MKINDFNISEFSHQISQHLQHVKYQNKDFQNIENFPIIKSKQCLYVMNWKETKLTYAKGIKEMLGYGEDEFTMPMVLGLIHPDDSKFVIRIIKGIVKHSVNNNVSGEGQYLKLTYRLKKKDGNYIKVLRMTSPHEIDYNNNLISNFSLLTDISFINNNDKVEWDVHTNDLNAEGFKKNIYNEFLDFFTGREHEVITCLEKGYNTKTIADKLNISFYTVQTHRKNILRKSRCHNIIELLSFCRNNGII
jgi:DNA-binding CsgD family transcriptional regulator